MDFQLPKIDRIPSPEALERFVYVVGTVRGGTSLLRDAMAVHPRLLLFPYLTHFMNHVWRYRRKIHERLLRLIIRLPSFVEPGLESPTDPDDRAEIQAFFNRVVASRELRRMWSLYPVAYSLSPDMDKDPAEILCWGEKANDFTGMDAIARAFPRGRFVCILRDPRNAVSSMAVRATRKEDLRSKGFADHLLLDSCIHWTHMTQRILRFASRHPGRCHVMTFEDLLTAPEETLNRIFEFLGLGAMDRQELSGRLGALNYGASNSAESGKGLDKRPLERWRTTLSERNLELVGQVAGATARKAGYDISGRMTPLDLPRLARLAPSPRHAAVALAKLAALQAMDLATRPLARG
jgi:hypothetical protein